MNEPTPQEFESLLRRAMQTRPLPAAPEDLARRAMRIAGFVRTGTGHLPRLHFWTNLVALAASLVIVGLLAVGGYEMMNGNSTSSATSPSASAASGTTDTVESGTTSSETSSAGSSTLSTLVAGVIVVAAAGALWGSRGQVVVVGAARA